MFELDHLMLCAKFPDTENDALTDFGLKIGHRGQHPGQGTANTAFFFDNAYLELIWIHEPSELDQDEIAPTGLAQRLRWVESGASPFGVSFRRVAGTDAPLPIDTWDYHAPFLPEGAVPIPISTSSSNLSEPLVFASLMASRPDTRSPQPVLQRAQGFREITGLQLTFTSQDAPSSTLRILEEIGVSAFCHDERAHATVEIDGAASGKSQNFSPVLPLTLRW